MNIMFQRGLHSALVIDVSAHSRLLMATSVATGLPPIAGIRDAAMARIKNFMMQAGVLDTELVDVMDRWRSYENVLKIASIP